MGVVLGKGQVREILEWETVNEMISTWRAQQLERKIKRLVNYEVEKMDTKDKKEEN